MDNCSGPNLCPVAWFYADFGSVGFMDNRGLYSFWRYFSCCAFQVLILLSLVFPSFAVDGEEASNSFYGFDSVNPVPVYIVPDDLSLDVSAYAAGDDFPFYGSAWVEGTASGLGTVQLFLLGNGSQYSFCRYFSLYGCYPAILLFYIGSAAATYDSHGSFALFTTDDY